MVNMPYGAHIQMWLLPFKFRLRHLRFSFTRTQKMNASLLHRSNGAHDADRTRDLVLTKDVLYQLSYMGPRHDFTTIHFSL